MSRQVTLEIRDEQGHLQGTVPGVLSRFSPWKAFPLRGDAQEIELAYSLAVHLRSFGRRLCFYRSGPFLEHFLRWAAVAWAELPPVVDPSGGADLSAPRVVRSLDELTPGHDVVFVADTEAERTHRVVSSLPPGITVVTPGVLGTLRGWTPREAWIPEVPSIYPIVLPEVRFRAGLDLLLLDLPARAGQQPSVGFSYVHKALARTGLQFQSVDLDPIWYHRFHMRRILDTGEEPRMSNGLPLSVDAWGYNERAWNDPRKWPFLIALFRDQIDEIVTGILAARPKVLGLSVHARNEWITRHVARVIKAAAPEIVILAGGHSCYSEPFGRGAFPEHDYLVVGEADLVIGPLVEALARGERPANTPGVVCRHDDPAVPFVPGPQPHNLDALGGIALDIWPDLNFLYQTFQGARSTATPLTRGCVWSRCSFCAERFAFRSRSPANYVDELEHILQTGRGGQFSASDSDFGGDPAVLLQICEEIVRRGLKLNFGGQIRLNKNYDVDAFRLMKAAGVTSLNFGADAFTENTIRLQAKGYTLETLLRNHADCAAAGIQPAINMVIGVPGETDQDITDTIRLLSENRHCFPAVNNINVCQLVQNSVYWFQPEKFKIGFYGDRKRIYERYYFGVPTRLWFSMEPYIDQGVRLGRFRRLLAGLEAARIPVGPEAYANLADTANGGGHLDYREWMVDDLVELSTRPAAQLPVASTAPRRGPPRPGFVARVGADGYVLIDADARAHGLLASRGVPVAPVD